MSVTIDSLDIQISTSAGQSVQKIKDLSDALGDLRQNAKLTTVVNNLNKLKNALDTLPSTSNAVAKLRSLSNALKGLSTLPRLTNFAAALKELNKVPGIVNNLDAITLDRFRKAMEKLADAMKPLATQMKAIAKGFSSLPQHIHAATQATNALAGANHNVNGSWGGGSVGLMATISNYETLISVMNSVINTVSGFMAQAIEWDGIQFRFGRAFGEDAEEVYQYVLKINEVLGINTQEFMQYSSLYGSLLSGFGMAQEKITSISVGLTELSYDIWAAYNDRFKTLEDASEAVRSAITGEIEPIRNAGIALTEASLQEFIDSTHLAGVSIEKLTEAQKSEVRYAAMVNAAMNQGIIGTYAREMNTAEGAVRSLSQSFKTLTQALGSLFIPMLQVVVPYVTAFVELLTEAVFWVARLFNIPIQEISWESSSKGVGGLADGAADAASGLGSAADAAKKLKNYTMGFDELNVIDPNSGSGSGGGKGGAGGSGWGEGLDLDNIWDESIFAQASKKVDELKEKVLGFLDEWKTELIIIGAALATLGVVNLINGLSNALQKAEEIGGVLGTISKIASSAIIVTVQYALQSKAFGDFASGEGKIWDYIEGLLIGAGSSFLLYKQWGAGGLVIGLGVTAVASLKAIIENGGVDSAESATVAITGLASAAGSLWGAWKLLSKTDVGAFFQLLKEGEPFLGVLAAMFPKAATIISTATTWVTGTLVPAITSAITTGLGAIATALGVSVGWAVAIVAAIAAAIGAAIWTALHWDEVKKFFTESVPEWFSGVKEKITEWWENFDWSAAGYAMGRKAAKAFKGAKEWFSGIIDGAKTFFGEDLPRFFKEDVPRFFTEVIPGVLTNITESFLSFWKETVPDLWSGFVKFFTEELPNWLGEMGSIGKDIVLGIWDGITGAWDEFWGNIKEWIDGFVQGFNDELEISSPSKLFARIGEFIVEGLLSGITSKWEDLVTWFTEVIAPKFTLEYWLLKFAVITDAFTTKMEEFKTGAKKKWNEITAWFKKTISPKFTAEYWLGIFHNLVESFRLKMEEWQLTAEEKWLAITTWFDENIAPKLTVEYWKGRFDTLVQAIREKLDEFKRTANEKWDVFTTWFNSKITPKLTLTYWKGRFDTLVQAIRSKLDEYKKTASDKWSGIVSWYKSSIAPKFTKEFWMQKFDGLKTGFVQTIKNMVNLGVDALNEFIDWLNDNLVFKWDGLTIKGKEIFPGGQIQLFTIPHIPRFEKGGFLEDGLFTMNHGEIAGKFSNGRSVVANNEQIVAGIAEGVYSAVVAAMADSRGNEGERPVVVYLDGKQIYTSVKRSESQRGVSLMGNQLGYTY